MNNSLIEKMKRVFSESLEIRAGEGLSRAELRKLYNHEYVEKRLFQDNKSGSQFYVWRLSTKGAVMA